MKKVFKTFWKYFCYCGIEKEEFKKVKKAAYISNFEMWKILNLILDVTLGILVIVSLLNDFVGTNRLFYLIGFIYSLIATVIFFLLKKDSLIGQLLIYLTISMLFLFGAFIAQNKPEVPAVSFIAFLLITPLFMVDKPYFMSLELVIASAIFLTWMYYVKTPDAWQTDLVNVIIYTFVGILIHILVNSFRIKEFVLISKINIQKDTDELTGLKNKDALTREINSFMLLSSNNKGILYVIDIDYFKNINDTYGHDTGDVVLHDLGSYLKQKFLNHEIVGRFGGDEFIIFLRNNDDVETARKIAGEIAKETTEQIKLPEDKQKFSVSIGVAVYRGHEKNYSELFKKADLALYKVKANREMKFCIYEDK